MLTQVREINCRRSSLCFRVLLLPLVLILSLRKLRGFLLYGFPGENYLCLLSLVSIAMHVILLDKILRSYCLNDKNLTTGSVSRGNYTWLVDSGASKHMTGYTDSLSCLVQKESPQKLMIGDDYQYPIKGMGEAY